MKMMNFKKANINQKSSTYPTVDFKNNQLLENKINTTIERTAKSMIPGPEYKDRNIISAASKYDIAVNKNEIFSIRLENYFFPEKAANGVTKVKGITINIINGKIYRLKDLFIENSNYKSLLDTIIKMEIKKNEIPLLEEFPGIKGNEEFYLTDNELVIVYQRYELTPGYYGVLEFKIPYDKLNNVIDKNSPIYLIQN